MSLTEHFSQTFTTNDLKELLKLVNVPGKPTRKDERVELLVRALTTPHEVRRLWKGMSDIERKAIASAFHNDGVFDVNSFVAQYQDVPRRPDQGRYNWYGKLYVLDLFFMAFHRYGTLQNNRIHPELMPLLEPLMPPPDRFELQGVTQAPIAVQVFSRTLPLRSLETEARGPHDLLLLLALFNQGEIKYTSSGDKLTKKSQETLEAKLAATDPDEVGHEFLNRIRATGLAQFGWTAGLVERGGKLTDAGKTYLATESPAILFDAFLQWSEQGTFDEISLIDGIRGTNAKGVRLTPPSTRRERIVEALSWAPTGVWISLVDFYRAIHIWHMDFDVEEGGLDRLHVGSYVRSGRYAEPWADTQNVWLFINGLYINAVLWAFLSSIGALDIVYAEDSTYAFPAHTYDSFVERPIGDYDGLVAFRITPLGAYLFGQADSYEVPKSAEDALFTISAEGVISLLPGVTLNEAHRAQLEQIADLKAQRYVLSRQKLLIYLESNKDLSLPRSFLAQRSRDPLPGDVTRFLDQVEADSRAATVKGRMLSITISSAEVAQQILDDPTAGKIARQLDNRTLIILESRKTAFRNALREMGYGLRE